jgi:hypothetical protein
LNRDAAALLEREEDVLVDEPATARPAGVGATTAATRVDSAAATRAASTTA